MHPFRHPLFGLLSDEQVVMEAVINLKMNEQRPLHVEVEEIDQWQGVPTSSGYGKHLRMTLLDSERNPRAGATYHRHGWIVKAIDPTGAQVPYLISVDMSEN